MSIGLVGRKSGMTRIFTEEGASVPVTVVEVQPNRVTQIKTLETDGYSAIQVTTGSRKASRVSKAAAGHFAKANTEAGEGLWEFRADDLEGYELGGELKVDLFEAGQKVDVTGTSIGKGFAGAMKRHNFGGLRASHGVSISHRSHGSTGQCQDPGKVFKGKKMAGHMGAARVTTQNLEVVKTDAERGLVFVKGAVPGSKGGWVTVKDAVKKKLPDGVPFPAALKTAAAAAEAAAEAPAEGGEA